MLLEAVILSWLVRQQEEHLDSGMYKLLHFYTAVIRPVLEYTSPVWHYSITRAQSQHLESIQNEQYI